MFFGNQVSKDIKRIMKNLPERANKRYDEELNKKLAIARLAESGDKAAIEALHRFIDLREFGKLKPQFPDVL